MEKLQTSTGTAWIDEKLQIMRFVYAPGAVCTLKEAKENLEIQRKLLALAGKRMPLLIDVKQAKSIDREARMFYAEVDDFTANALVGGTPIGNVIANFFVAVYGNRGIPTKLFTTDSAALAWLAGLGR